MGSDGIHPRVWRQLLETLTKTLSIICLQSLITVEVPVDCNTTNVTPIYKKGGKEDLGSYEPDFGARRGYGK